MAGAGYYLEAFFCTLLIMFINGVLKNTDRWINRKLKDGSGEDEDY
jgi:hypothetical protein